MLPAGKTTPSSGASLVLAGNKAASASPSVVSAKQAPAGGLVLAVDGKRSVATLAAVQGRGPAFSDDDHKPKGSSAEKIKTMAAETSALLRGLCVPKQSSIAEQVCFTKEVDALQKACDGMVEGAFFDEDGAINMLIGVHARIRLLLTSDNKLTPQEFLLSSMGEIKASVEEYMSAEDKIMGEADQGRTSLYEMVKKSSLVEPTPTVCSDDEVKAVLYKTLTLLESSDPAHSTTGMACLFYKVRSNCRALMEDVEKNGVDGKTGSAIAMIHISALFVLGQHKKYFSYDDAADDSLMASLRRLEVALRDYELGGPSSPPSETTD
uniref:Uncharacterized protein n=2 Tax=Aegilops tauschii TaxID=37682 RepID=M8BSG7_AEGTA